MTPRHISSDYVTAEAEFQSQASSYAGLMDKEAMELAFLLGLLF
jgi:hypothetical protein